MDKVFTYINTYNRVNGPTFIEWAINPITKVTAPIEFSVYFSDTATSDNWQLLGTVTDSYYYIDPVKRQYGVDHASYYQVRFTQNGIEYVSPPRNTTYILDGRDNAIVSEIIRKELLLLKTYSGNCGYLYKRRIWGITCSSCVDYDTGAVTSAQCPTCYGTGFVGGYFDPCLFYIYVRQTAPERKVTVIDGQGVVNPIVMQGRCIPCPRIETGDIWRNAFTDDCFVIQQINNVVYKGVPIANEVELRLVQKKDILYSLPRPEDDIMSSSSSSS